MSRQEFVLSVLEKTWRSEVRMAGRGTVDRLISASAAGKSTAESFAAISDSGTPYDVQLMLNTLTVAIAFVNLCIKVVEACRKAGTSEEETKQKLQAEVANNKKLEDFSATEKARLAFQSVYAHRDEISAS